MTRGLRVLVTGAGGFIGHHLASRLVSQGCWVRGVDRVYPAYEATRVQSFEILDLRRWRDCLRAARDVDEVYHLAADTSTVGAGDSSAAAIARDNGLIDLHLLEAVRANEVRRFLFTSSERLTPQSVDAATEASAPREEDAWLTGAGDAPSSEKRFAERLCCQYRCDFGLETRIARLRDVFGPLTAFDTAGEETLESLCRRVASAADNDVVEVWGNGEAVRAYCYVDDCVEGIVRLMRSDYTEPLDIGGDRTATTDELVDLIAAAAGKTIKKEHWLDAPVRAPALRADHRRMRQVLGWVPQTSLERGIERTYAWVAAQLRKHEASPG